MVNCILGKMLTDDEPHYGVMPIITRLVDDGLPQLHYAVVTWLRSV